MVTESFRPSGRDVKPAQEYRNMGSLRTALLRAKARSPDFATRNPGLPLQLTLMCGGRSRLTLQ